MSAGPTPIGQPEPKVSRDLTRLAPKLAEDVRCAIEDANAAGLDAYVYEANRSHELAVLYYARGRTIIPPQRTVTNAPDETYSWHGYALAVDVISRKYLWFDNKAAREKWPDPKEREAAGVAFWTAVSVYFFRRGCRWGGEWKQKDYPHFQFGKCRASPSDEARRLLSTTGIESVWRAVGAL